MNKKERKTIVAALEISKLYLWDGEGEWTRDKSEYICIALYDAWSASPKYGKVVCYIRELIEYRLCGTNSLEKWLKVYMEIPADQITPQRMQAHRLAWINLLIEEFSV